MSGLHITAGHRTPDMSGLQIMAGYRTPDMSGFRKYAGHRTPDMSGSRKYAGHRTPDSPVSGIVRYPAGQSGVRSPTSVKHKRLAFLTMETSKRAAAASFFPNFFPRIKMRKQIKIYFIFSILNYSFYDISNVLLLLQFWHSAITS